MKSLFIILLCSTFIHPQSQENIPAEIKEEIDKGIDHYNLALYEDSKRIFLDILYSDEGKKYEAEIRFHIGLALFYEEKPELAFIQWKQIIKKYPTSERAKLLNRYISNRFREFSEDETIRDEDFAFSQDDKTGRLFWKSIPLNAKFFFDDLQDGETAVKFYEGLIKKYDDPNKKLNFLYYLFLIYAGYNGSYYGYENTDTESGEKNISDKDSEKKVIEILSQMENFVASENDPNHSILVQCYYLWGVRKSGSKLFSGRVRVNKHSKPYFEKVIELTENEQNNIYRIFSQHWLK